MEILLTEAAPGDADAVARKLETAGHRVSRCNLPGSDRCAPMANHVSCPLRERVISAVVDVRGRPEGFGVHELGAMCAVQAGVPLVVCGPTADEDGPWRDADVRCTEDALLDVLAFADPVTGLAGRHRVERAVTATLRAFGHPGTADVAIRSEPGVVLVTVTIDGNLPVMLLRDLPIAVRGALAALTPHWAQAQVTVTAR
jgi:hypothetical protein